MRRLSNARYQYYVEGECERKLVKTLIGQDLVIPGQTDVLNPVQEHIKMTHLRKLPPKATIVLIFDTDTGNVDILKDNLLFLSSHFHSRNIVTIPQVHNLEEELIQCTNIRRIRELINCQHDSDFKTAFIEEKRLFDKLQDHSFRFDVLWSSQPDPIFRNIGIQNQSKLIKLI